MSDTESVADVAVSPDSIIRKQSKKTKATLTKPPSDGDDLMLSDDDADLPQRQRMAKRPSAKVRDIYERQLKRQRQLEEAEEEQEVEQEAARRQRDGGPKRGSGSSAKKHRRPPTPVDESESELSDMLEDGDDDDELPTDLDEEDFEGVELDDEDDDEEFDESDGEEEDDEEEEEDDDGGEEEEEERSGRSGKRVSGTRGMSHRRKHKSGRSTDHDVLRSAMKEQKVALKGLRQDLETLQQLESMWSMTPEEARRQGIPQENLVLIESFDDDDVAALRKTLAKVSKLVHLMENDFGTRVSAYEKAIETMSKILDTRASTVNQLERKTGIFSRYPDLALHMQDKQARLQAKREETEKALLDGFVSSLADVRMTQGELREALKSTSRKQRGARRKHGRR
jgi:hypothetical protein